MSKDLLLEIGTEEIPARFMPGILAQLEEAAKKKFAELRVEFTAAKAYGTPRRMALFISDVARKQADISAKNKGPSVQIAFDTEGKPTKAALGFARGQKVEAKDLIVEDGYVYAVVHESGKPTADLLPEVLTAMIAGMNFPKNMRWADLDIRFVRPIKWIVALFGKDMVDFTFAGVTSGRVSRGHRFLGGAVEIEEPASYVQALKSAFVLVDQDVRRAMIREQIETLAKEKGGVAEISEDLLEEVVYLVEYPTALCGKFEEKYLKLPPETVITPMREHQRYFPVKKADGTLLPMFITVRNGGKEHLETVQHGNERVLRARLADAQFFFEEDCKVKLVDRLEKLKSVVFQEGLGSIYEKTQRLMKMGVFLAEQVGAEEAELPVVERAAKLAKTDLVTGMVCEFTELQGIMGREYARLNGEEEAVASAIYEHYLPRFAGDVLPESLAGRLVSIADKMDNIVATFSRGLVPTGSQDPYALRRQALGIVNILINAKYALSLRGMTQKAMDLIGIDESEERNRILTDVEEFFLLRIKNVLSDEGIRYDIVDAVLSVEKDNLYAAYLKSQALSSKLTEEEIATAVQAFVRAANLAKKAQADQIDETLLHETAEKNLYQAYTIASNEVGPLLQSHAYEKAMAAMASMAAPIHSFFEGVMVMDKNIVIQNNRLALLKKVVDLTRHIADFTRLV